MFCTDYQKSRTIEFEKYFQYGDLPISQVKSGTDCGVCTRTHDFLLERRRMGEEGSRTIRTEDFSLLVYYNGWPVGWN